MTRRNPIWLCWPFLPVLGCTNPVEHANSYVVRDSVGLTIVESSSPTWGEEGRWHVESEPIFDLSGRDHDELSNLRAPRLLSDGHLVLYNAGSCEIRVYDEQLRLASSWGSCGKGPGEFDNFSGLWPWGSDSLLIVDQIPSRVSIFAQNGDLGRTIRVPVVGDAPVTIVSGVLDGGTIVTSGERHSTARGEPGIRASQWSLALIHDLGEAPELIGVFPGPVWEYTAFDGRLGRGRLAFSSSAAKTLSNDRVFLGFQDRYEILVFDATGSLQRIIRRSYDSVQVTQRDIDWLLERRLSEVEGAENERIVRRWYSDLHHSEFMPAFGVPTWPGTVQGGPSLLADDVGNLWVFDHYRPGEYRNRWTVFSPEGVWLGGVSLPDRLEPRQIGRSFVIGLWRDEDGFVHVRRHRLIKS